MSERPVLQLRAALAELALAVFTSRTLSENLERLVGVACRLIPAGASGSVAILVDGQPTTSAVTDHLAFELDVVQYDTGEGPCLDSYAQNEQISTDLREPGAATFWPGFTDRALEMGFTGVQALPMRLRTETIGALNVFHVAPGRLDEHDTALAQSLADVATIAILQYRALHSSQELAGQLQIALNDRIVIEQAKGLLAERGQLDVEAAFHLLRDYCRSSRLPLTTTARALVSGQRDPDDVLAYRWPRTPGT
jgi:GAF domain-containing protein